MRSLGRAALTVSLAMVAGLTGCGVPAPNCSGGGLVLEVRPATGVADHMAAAPGNQVRFEGSASYTASPGCAVPALAFLEFAAWTNPDPKNIQISSATDETNGTAVCQGSTSGAVTLTGEFAPLSTPPATTTTSKTVTLTCK